MVGMTPWGVFFLACKLPYTKCWLLCQQAQVETHFSTIFVLSKTALKSNTGALALGQTNGGFCHCRNTSQIEMYFLCRSMAFGEEGGRMLTLSASPPIPRIRKAAVKRLFVRIPPW